MGVMFQKNALPTFFNFTRARKSHQSHVENVLIPQYLRNAIISSSFENSKKSAPISDTFYLLCFICCK